MLTIPKTFLLLKIVPTSRNNINSINITLQYSYSLHPLQWGCRGGIGRVSTIVVRTSSMSRAASATLIKLKLVCNHFYFMGIPHWESPTTYLGPAQPRVQRANTNTNTDGLFSYQDGIDL